mgnify:FL=1
MIQKITEYFANIKKRNLYAKDIYNQIQSIYNNRKDIKIPIVVWSDNIHFQYNANLLKAYEYCAFFSPELPPYWLSIEDANKKLNIIKNPLENQAIRINKIFDYLIKHTNDDESYIDLFGNIYLTSKFYPYIVK